MNLTQSQPRGVPSSSSKPTVAIIDDDEGLSKHLYKILLERNGYRVLTAKSGISGLALLKAEYRSPEMVFVDCSMPEMDGETFLIALKAAVPKIFSESKIVGLTGYHPNSPTFQKIKGLAYDCREKPSDIKGILQIVSDYIGSPSEWAYSSSMNKRLLQC